MYRAASLSAQNAIFLPCCAPKAGVCELWRVRACAASGVSYNRYGHSVWIY